jgi:hypothetical protein
VLSQLAAAPVRGAIRRNSASPFQNPGLQCRSALLHHAPDVVGAQAQRPLGFEIGLSSHSCSWQCTLAPGVSSDRIALAPTTESVAPDANPPPAVFASAFSPLTRSLAVNPSAASSTPHDRSVGYLYHCYGPQGRRNACNDINLRLPIQEPSWSVFFSYP